MLIDFQSVIAELLAIKPLPNGYSMEVDPATDNILVRGPTLGFAITKEAILDNLYKAQYPVCLDRLIEIEEGALVGNLMNKLGK
jgi:hypothetical protein